MLEEQTIGPHDADLTIVLCHGFGADESDLVPLATELSTAGNVRFRFPRAPHAFPSGWGPGRAWFPAASAEIAAFAGGGLFADLAPLDPPSLADAGRALAATLGASPAGGKLVVGGFSQGAMVACEALLSAGLVADGLVVLSGALIAADRWGDLARGPARPLDGVPVFQAHGTSDPILPFDAGLALGALLDSGRANRVFHEFDAGHGIPPGVLDALAVWIAEQRSR